MKNIFNYIRKEKNIWLCGALLCTLSTGCSDYLDREPMSEYLSSNFYNNEGAIKQGATACYQRLKMDHTNSSSSNIPCGSLYI